MTDRINSESYWDARFSTDWDEKDGPGQSRFFSRVAIDRLPRWLLRAIREQQLSVVDWGCAEGDGTDELAALIDARQLSGVDFSHAAIERASQRYPAIRFIQANWLDESPGADAPPSWDIVFSSNTLEHFHQPFEVLKVLCARARKALVLVLPYRERDRIEEHHFSFLPDNLPATLPNGFRLTAARVADCRKMAESRWAGEQIVLVYALPAWLDDHHLMLSDCEIAVDDAAAMGEALEAVAQSEREHEARQAELQQLVAQRDAKLTVLEDQLRMQQQAQDQQTRQLQALEEQLVDRDRLVSHYHARVEEIWGSASWRLTKPLRAGKMALTQPKVAAYKTLRAVYQGLPGRLQLRLNGLRHRLVRQFRSGTSTSGTPALSSNAAADWSWDRFRRDVLNAPEGRYKGVFIQEAVIDWNVPLYQRPQHMAAAFGRLGYLVIYRTDNWGGDDVQGFREVATNVWLTNSPEVNRLEAMARSFYSTTYAHTPRALMAYGKRGTLIYEYIDHIDPEISGDPENIRRLVALKDFAFGGGADVVVASARKLYDEAVAAVGPERVVLVPNGVDTRHYRDPAHLAAVLPRRLLEFRARYSLVVGYFGALAPWLWYEVVAELVRLRPDVGFVFIGPDYYGGARQLVAADNLLYLGPVDYKDLPAHGRQFDLCMIPFKPGEIAQTTSPLKLFEYFALEKPVVVSSDMRECVAFPEVFHGDSAAALSEAIDRAARVKDDEAFRQRLRELADENDWIERARVMAAAFAPSLSLTK